MSTRAEPTILIVDDDLRLRTLLGDFLGRENLTVNLAGTWKAAMEQIRRVPPDLIVLDLMLPGTSGLEACRELRGTGSDLPIIMLTARGSDIDRILGLEMGADDYVTKPCNPRELLARIRAVLRRRPGVAPGAPAAEGEPIRFGDFVLDPVTRQLTRGGERVVLSTGEFAVLHALAARPHQTLSRDELLRLARGRRSGAFDRSIDVQIARLRRLIEADPARPLHLQTVRGSGYVFVPARETDE